MPRNTSLLNVAEVLEQLIMGEYGLAKPEQFLEWVATSDDYYAKKLCSDWVRGKAQGLYDGLQRGCTYANADVDWRISVRDFVMSYVPAQVWVSYRNMIAAQEEALGL
jgi:hypothetical protein